MEANVLFLNRSANETRCEALFLVHISNGMTSSGFKPDISMARAQN